MNEQHATIDMAKVLLHELQEERKVRHAARTDYKAEKRVVCNIIRQAERELAEVKLMHGNTLLQLKQHIAKLRIERRASMKKLRHLCQK